MDPRSYSSTPHLRPRPVMPLLLLILLLLLSGVVQAQSDPEQPTKPQLAIVTVAAFSGNGGTYTGQLKNWRDVYEVGYTGTGAQVGDLFADAAGRIYELTSVTSSTAVSADVVLNCLSPVVGSPIGTGQVWRPLDSGLYPVAPDGDNQIGRFLQGILLSHNAAIAGGSGGGAAGAGFRDTTLTASGLTVSITFSGDAPVLSGSPGSYALTVPADGDWQQLAAVATSSSAATSSNDFAFQIVNTDGRTDRSSVTLTDLGNGEVVTAPKLEYGILVGQAASGSTVTTSLTGVGGLSGFVVQLVR